MPKTLEQALGSIATMTDKELLTKSDFVDAFKEVVNFLKRMEERQTNELSVLRQLAENSTASTQDELRTRMSNLEKRVSKELEDSLSKIDETLFAFGEKVNARISEVKDGKDADEEAMLATLFARIPSLEAITQSIPMQGERVRDALELLQGEEKLDESAIKNLPEDLEKLRAEIKNASGRIVGGGAIQNTITVTDLTSQCNGSLKVFQVPKQRYLFLVSSQAPHIYRPTTDFTGDGTGTLTLTSEVGAPQTGQTLLLYTSRL